MTKTIPSQKPSDADAPYGSGTETPANPSSQLSVAEYVRLYDDARSYVDRSFRKDWDKYYKIYRLRRTDRHYEGISDPVIPEGHTIIETLVANIAGGDPEFHFIPTNEEQSLDTEVLNELLDYYLLCNKFGLKNQEWVRDMLLYGTGIIHITWADDKPKIDNVPLRDFFVDPTATGIDVARYAGLTYLGNKEDMKKEQVYDADEQAWVPKYNAAAIDRLQKTFENQNGGDQASMDKAFKDDFNKSTLGEKAIENQVQVILMYHLPTGKLIEIGNRKEILRIVDIPYQREASTITTQQIDPTGKTVSVEHKIDAIKPFLPFAPLRDYVDTSLFYGEGEMAIIADRQEMLNDLEAMDTDNIAYQNTPMYWIDPQFADLAPEIETIPGAVYPIPRNAMGALERPQLGQDLDLKKDRVIAQMRSATAADEAVQGIGQDKGRVTATEVSTQLAQSQNRFSTKVGNLENEGYAYLGQIIFKLVQVLVTQPMAVRIVGKDGVHFKDYDPAEFSGDYEAHVRLDSTIKQHQLEVGQKNAQLFELMIKSPVYNPVEVQRFIVQHLDPEMTDEEFNKLLAPPAPPKDDSKELITFNYKDAPPFIASQIESKFGFQPDPAHAGEIAAEMHEQASRITDIHDPSTNTDNQPLAGMADLHAPTPIPKPAGMAA